MLSPRQRAALAAISKQATKADFRAFMARTSPRYGYPAHLRPYLDILETAASGQVVEAVVSTPPRHTKTTTTLHKIVQLMGMRPGLKVAYITYGAELSESKSREAKQIALDAGLELAPDRASNAEWELTNRSRFTATGIGGPLTGKGFHLVVVDDPHKGRAEAESVAERTKVIDWFNSVAYTRKEPGGTSFIVIQTRWHPDDLAGKLISKGWQCVNLPAIDEHEQALWPESWPVSELRKIEAQIGPYEWSSLYQGQPRSRGASVFGEPTYYDELPRTGYRISIGADFAYTKRTYSDYNVAVVLYHVVGGVSFVAEVLRVHETVDVFAHQVRALQAKHGGKVTAYVAATERGVTELLKTKGLRVDAITATTDKFSRAQPVAAAWRTGKVLVPRSAPWLDAFMGEVMNFTGVSDDHDDQVDALAGAFHPFALGYSKERVDYGDEGFTFG